ncbi:hypothetical protein D1007_32148 [Hordeum vulgare]|nr:hypothetical protein D1007_32148 [Hordeum vulgare]
MALLPECPPDLRIYDSVYDCGLSSRREQAEHRSRLLDKIRDSYREALERLNLRARPGMAARLLHGGGFCLGLVDPVSNILANTLVSSPTGARSRSRSRNRTSSTSPRKS